jgi:putative ABC transport system ATP-binding protein
MTDTTIAPQPTAPPVPAPNPNGHILVEDVAKEYQIGRQRIEALRGVCLDVPPGAFVAVMGASGSGKSTLLNSIGGLDHPTRGRIRVGADEITAMNEAALSAYRRRRVGFIFQKFNLIGAFTAAENVAFPLIFAGVPDRQRRQRAERALAAVGLSDRQRHRPSEMSGGEQQRVAVARALVNDPDILLADEPTGNLDSHTSLEVMKLLQEICAGGRTVMMVTHDERLANYAGQIVHMRDGAIVASS